jgi:isocitrate dehydrogenase kinase/phosphatase
MPKRPLGLHYSTIGFNHVGKVAVMSELQDELARTNEVLETAIGFRGTVAIGFSAPTSAYNLKVIRDKPTVGYKWGEFEGIDSVLKKYGRVHEINRTGSMLDNIIYYNLKLDEAWFDPTLLEELLREASKSVSLQGDAVVFKYLIVQRRMTPLPVFLETASPTDAEIAIVNLGYCIKNNAAANIFNKDLDARNYGVSRMLKVFLYDYDALEPFTDVKIRTNQDVVYGEEDAPDWYFEDGVVFLPEEIEAGLIIPNRSLVELFHEVHGDLLTTEYWQRIQNDLRAGRVPSLRVYPESRKLVR